MALKISVTLPNGTLIAVEADESDTYDSLTDLALRELPSRLASAPDAATPPATQRVQQDVAPPTTPATPSQTQRNATIRNEKVEKWEEFRAFCKRANPLGDMRRLVVAAEGARRSLGMESVSTAELASLFQTLEWTQPSNLVQTLRNSARSTFQWMERVPGRRGFYTVTDTGREAVLGEDYSPE